MTFKLSTAAVAVLAALGIDQKGITEPQAKSFSAALTEHASGLVAEARSAALAEGEQAGAAKAAASNEAALTAAKAEGSAQGAKAERERVRGILAHAEAKERSALAASLALDTELTAEQAGAVLAKAPKEKAGSALAAAMAGVPNPDVGVDTAAADGKKASINTSSIYESRRHAAAGQQS